MTKRLDKLLKESKRIKINKKSKIVIMSDCHRGNGSNHDNFLKNEAIYKAALKYYLKNNFTYIELGDGDELWEVDDPYSIVDIYYGTFKILKEFNDKNKLIMIYGNHDIDKQNKDIIKKYFEEHNGEELLSNLNVLESLVLEYHGKEIFLIHGHQVDILNSIFWRLSRFLVRHVWRYLELVGFKDLTSAAKNYHVAKSVEKKLFKWSRENNKILIAGHTHRPILPKVGEGLYFNDGSCIHPNGITCIEIEHGHISLVKFFITVLDDGSITVSRELLAGNVDIESFYADNL